MTKHCCPKCKEHPVLDETLKCILCEGQYVWKEKGEEK